MPDRAAHWVSNLDSPVQWSRYLGPGTALRSFFAILRTATSIIAHVTPTAAPAKMARKKFDLNGSSRVAKTADTIPASKAMT
jgi:hypothetical protein